MFKFLKKILSKREEKKKDESQVASDEFNEMTEFTIYGETINREALRLGKVCILYINTDTLNNVNKAELITGFSHRFPEELNVLKEWDSRPTIFFDNGSIHSKVVPCYSLMSHNITTFYDIDHRYIELLKECVKKAFHDVRIHDRFLKESIGVK